MPGISACPTNAYQVVLSMFDSGCEGGFVVLDQRGLVIAWNAAASRIIGYSAADVRGKAFVDFLQPDEGSSPLQTESLTALLGQSHWDARVTLVRPDKTCVHVDICSHSLDPEDLFGGIGVSIREVLVEEATSSVSTFGGSRAFSNSDVRLLCDGLPSGLLVLDHELRCVYANPIAAGYLRQPSQALIGRTIRESCSAIKTHEFDEQLQKCLAESRDGLIETEFTFPDGARATFAVKIWSIPSGVACSWSDVSPAVLANQTAPNERDRLVKLAETAPGVLHSFCLRPDGTTCFPYASPSIFQIYGQTPEALAVDASTIFDLIHPDDVAHVRSTIDESARTMNPWRDEFRVRSPIRGEIWIEGHSSPIREADGDLVWHGFICDISDRKRASELLRASKNHLDLALTAGRMGIFDWNIVDERVVWSPMMYEHFGYPKEELFEVQRHHWLGRLSPEGAARAESMFSGRSKVEPEFTEDTRLLWPDGSEHWIASTCRFDFDSDGHPIRLRGVVQDITDRKRAEIALRDSEEQHRLLFAENPVPLLAFDRQTLRFLAVNQAACDLYGYSETQFLNLSAPDVVRPDDRRTLIQVIRDLPPGRGQVSCWKHVRQDGADFDAEVTGNDVSFAGCQSRLIMVRDISDQQKIERALQASEERYRTFVTHTPDAVYVHDSLGTVIDANEQGLAQLQFPMDELLGKTPVDFDPDITMQAVQELTTQLDRGKKLRFETRHRRKDGTLFPVEVRLCPFRVNDARFALAVVRDISELKAAEAALKASESRLRQILNSDPECVKIIDTDGSLVDMNPAGLRLIEAESVEQARGADLLYLVVPEQRDRYLAAMARAFAGQSDIQEFEIIGLRGTRRWIEQHVVSLAREDAAAPPFQLVAVSRDITARILAAEAIAEHQRRLESIGDNLPDGAIYQYQRWPDRRHGFLYISNGCRRLFGVTPEQVLASPYCIIDQVHPDDRDQVRKESRESFETLCVLDMVHRSIAPDGQLRWIQTRAQPQRQSDDSVIWDGLILDITDRKRMEDELERSRQRLESLSRQLITTQEMERRHLARELHDEIGQVLTATKLFLNSLKAMNGVELQDRFVPQIAALDATIADVRNLSLSLRPAQLDQLGLVPALEWYLNYQADLSGFQAELQVNSPIPSIPPELATTCFRIVQESVNNAVRHADHRSIRVELTGQPSLVLLTIIDDGRGFDVLAAQDRASRGESLGLLGMRERAQLAGGELEISSTPGSGTRIRVWLPLPRPQIEPNAGNQEK